eukprot:351612-Chlamydomonas_euryale.AAC.27
MHRGKLGSRARQRITDCNTISENCESRVGGYAKVISGADFPLPSITTVLDGDRKATLAVKRPVQSKHNYHGFAINSPLPSAHFRVSVRHAGIVRAQKPAVHQSGAPPSILKAPVQTWTPAPQSTASRRNQDRGHGKYAITTQITVGQTSFIISKRTLFLLSC